MDTEISQVNVLYPEAKATSSVNWHRSSFPFVCVVMLSNMDGTKGGETCFRGPSCEIKTMDTFPMVRLVSPILILTNAFVGVGLSASRTACGAYDSSLHS